MIVIHFCAILAVIHWDIKCNKNNFIISYFKSVIGLVYLFFGLSIVLTIKQPLRNLREIICLLVWKLSILLFPFTPLLFFIIKTWVKVIQ